ncbi:MAG TPA: D-glycerate dehydrogenase, partial [Thermoanaerobaculia bacterium]
MSRDRIVITRRIPKAGMDVLDGSEARVTVVQSDEEQGLSREQVLEAVRAADVLLCQLTEPIDREVLSANDRLLGVAQMAVGFDNVDV